MDLTPSRGTSAMSEGDMSEGSQEPGTQIFTPDNIGRFCSDPRIVSALNGYVLLTRDEFLEWMKPPAIRHSERLEYRDEEEENVTNTYSELLQNMPIDVCEGITEDYGQAQMDNITMEDDNYDILVAVQSDYKSVNTFTRTGHLTRQKLAKIVGFIITEIGECKRLPRTVSVKLICAKKGTIKGSLLMGAYFDAIKNSDYDQEGILELARGYLNVSGFLSYTNMGFNKNTTLFGEDCFDDFRTLQMSIDLSEIDRDIIIGLASGSIKHPRAGATDDTGIYELYKRKILPIPEELLACNNLLLKAELDPRKLIEEFKNADSEECLLKPEEIDLLKRLGINESNFGTAVGLLNGLKDHLIAQAHAAPRKGGLRYYKKTTRKKNTRKKNSSPKKKSTRKKNRRRFTKKAKK